MRCLMSMGVILPPAARNSRYSGEIGPRAHLVQPGVLQQLADARVLADAVLDEEPAAARQTGRRLRTYGADGVHAIAACNERARRFIGERGEMGVAFGNIRRIGDDEFAALSAGNGRSGNVITAAWLNPVAAASRMRASRASRPLALSASATVKRLLRRAG